MADNVAKLEPPPPPNPRLSIGPEIGVSGLRVWSGYIDEEYHRELQGERGRRIYREMTDGDSVVGAILFAIGLTIRATKWRTEPAPDVPVTDADEAVQFVDSLFDDTSHTWEDFLAEVLTMMSYGWGWHEIVLKMRKGPQQADPSMRSKYDDGKIGIRKLAPRSQDTLHHWEMQDDGGIDGMWQQPWTGDTGLRFMPITRSLLFRTTSRKNNPEGVSILRTSYRSWYKLKIIEDIEAIGIERELAGLPVISIPAKYLNSSASDADKAIAAEYTKMARDLKFNEQGGIVKPSDCYPNPDGTVSSTPIVSIELLTTGGTRAIDTDKTVLRYQRGITRAVLADFIMLGTDSRGSHALSRDKTELFCRSVEAVLGQISAPINNFLLPRIWDINGMDRRTMPTRVPGKVAPEDIDKLGAYVQSLAAAGAELFPDEELENDLRERGDLPPKSEEAKALQDQQRQDALARFDQTGGEAGPPGADQTGGGGAP